MQNNKCQMCDSKLDFQNTINLSCGHQMILCLDCLMNISEKDQCKNCSQKNCCLCNQDVNSNQIQYTTLNFEDCKKEHLLYYCNNCFQKQQKSLMSLEKKVCFLCKVNLQKSKLLYYTDKLDCDKNHIVNLCGNCNQIFSKTKKRCLECKPLDIQKKYCIACNNEMDFEMNIMPISCDSKYHKFSMCLDCTDKLENPYLICSICQEKEEVNVNSFQICKNAANQNSLSVIKFISNKITNDCKAIDNFCCPQCNPIQVSPYFLTNILDDQKFSIPILSRAAKISNSQFIISGGYDNQSGKSLDQCFIINFFKDGRFKNFEVEQIPQKLQRKRHAHGCYFDTENNLIYIYGGITKLQDLSIEYLNSFEVIQIGNENSTINDKIQNIQNMKLHTPRADFQQCVYKNNIYMFGGFQGINQKNNNIEELNFKSFQTKTIQIQSKIDLPYKPCLLIDNNNKMLILGGFQNNKLCSYSLELDLNTGNLQKTEQSIKNQPKYINKINFNNDILLYGGKFNDQLDPLKFAYYKQDQDIVFNNIDMSRMDIEEDFKQQNQEFFDFNCFDFGYSFNQFYLKNTLQFMKKICKFVIFIFFFNFTRQQLSFYEQNIIDQKQKTPSNDRFTILGSEYAKLKYFKSINKNIDQKYKEIFSCLDNLKWNEFEQLAIEKCTGRNMSELKNFFFYEKKKILAQADAKIASIFVYYCYSRAGENQRILLGCDLLERDIKDLLWMELNFFELIKNHFQRYIEVQVQIPTQIFFNIFEELKIIQQDYKQIDNEFEDHRQLSLIRIERFIHQKIKLIEKLQKGQSNNQSLYSFSDQEEYDFDNYSQEYQEKIDEMNQNQDDYFDVHFNNDLLKDFKELEEIKKL